MVYLDFVFIPKSTSEVMYGRGWQKDMVDGMDNLHSNDIGIRLPYMIEKLY